VKARPTGKQVYPFPLVQFVTQPLAAGIGPAQQWRMADQANDPHWQDTQTAQVSDAPPHTARAPAPIAVRRPLDWRHPLVLALGLIAVIAVVSMSVRGCVEHRTRIAAEATARAQAQAAREEQSRIDEQQRKAAAQQQARQAMEEQREAAKLQAARKLEQEQEAARRASVAEAERKEQAWAKFYRKPASCNDATTMACTNDYIRAKREFERRYARGEL